MWRSSVEHLRKQGHAVRVLTTDYRNPDLDPAIEEGRDVHRDLRWYWRDHAWPTLSPLARWRLERFNLRTLDRHLSDFRPDTIAWWAMGGMSMSLIQRAHSAGFGAAAVVVDDWLLYGPRVDQWHRLAGQFGPLRRFIGAVVGVPSRLTFDAALEWVLVSEAIRGHARSAGWHLPRHTIAHAGIDHDLFSSSPSQPWGGRLLCVGRIDYRKGVDTAIRALTRLDGMTLAVVGSGDEDHLAELRHLVSELGLDARVRFERHPRHQLPTVYAKADAVVFPVRWDEPFGLVPLEAMAVGRPVVASGTGGSAEYLGDGENCLIYAPAEDSHALAAAISRLAEDPELREGLRQRGAETAEEHDEGSFNAAVEQALERAGVR